MKKNYLLIFLFVLVLPAAVFAQVPILNSNPSITNKVIYLDFDGHTARGTSWNSGNPVYAQPSVLNANGIRTVWQRVSEDYRPFDVNITTDSMRFNNAPPTKRMRVVITPTSAWYGSAGGVAYLNSFTWGGYPGTPCWVFENQLGNNAGYVGEACSHEAGHTLSLKHHSTWNATTCTKTAEYDPGQGTGVISWAPIMGVSYYNTVTTWYNGLSTTSCNVNQADHGSASPGITSNNMLSFLPDDVGNTYGNAKVLSLNNVNLLDSGIITTPTDVDAYKFTICDNRYVSFNIKPWAIDTTNYPGANLDVKFQLYDASGTLLITDASTSRLHALSGTNLTPGSYYFTIDGDGSPNYSDYGSIGKYYIRIKALNPPAITNSIVVPSNLCLNQNATFSCASGGSPSSWQWTLSAAGYTNTYSTQNIATTFTSTGIYTLSVYSSNGNSGSCETTQTVVVAAQPAFTASAGNTICQNFTTQVSAGSGASSYLWMPGAASGSVQIVSPTATTVYTVTGTNGQCSSSATNTVTVTPAIQISLTSNSYSICPGGSATVNVSGVSNFTVNPGGFMSNPILLSPSASFNYTINATQGACSKTITQLVTVTPDFTVNLAASDTAVCAGTSVTLTPSGTWSYSLNGTGISASVAVTPSVTGSYVLEGSNYVCAKSVTRTILVSPNYSVTLSSSKAQLCAGESVTVTSSGAATYTLEPGGITMNPAVITPTGSSPVYTVTGHSGYCSRTATQTFSISTDFSLYANVSDTLLCHPQAVFITASGAINYTFNPGNTINNPAAVTLSASTDCQITGNRYYCTKSITRHVTVAPAFSLNLAATNTVVCYGESLGLTASGASTYTFDPGGVTGNSLAVSPVSTIVYTVTGANAYNCTQRKLILLTVSECTGIDQQTDSHGFGIYPNPTPGELSLQARESAYITICSALGTLVFKGPIAPGITVQLDAGSWSCGVYMVHVTTEGGKTYSKKLVVHH